MERRCGCKRHMEYSDDGRLVKLSNKKIKKDVIKKLMETDDLNERATYLCQGCANYCQTKYLNGQSKSDIDFVCEKIRESKYETEDLEKIAKALGESQKNEILNQSKEENYDSIRNILNFDLSKYIESKNSVLLVFLMAATGSHLSSPINTLLYVAMAIDCIYSAVRPRYISLMSFMLSIAIYVISGSKMIVRVLSSFIPCGSYPVVKSFLKNLQHNELSPPPPKRDIVTFFDNNQIVCKNWNIQYNSKCKVSIITTSIHLVPPDETFLQLNQQLSPSVWLYNNVNAIDVIQKIKDIFLSQNDTFHTYRKNFIESILKNVCQEIKEGETIIPNMYDYEYVTDKMPAGSTSVFVAPPIFLNPCSYRAVTDVLNTLHVANTKECRKWSFIGCDGLPYVLGSRLIEKERNLQNILLMPGLGHYEINMAKSCFKLLWDVILEDTAKMLGFKSVRALTTCENANDHHKSMEILNIVLCASANELVFEHVRDSVHRDVAPTFESYCDYLQSVKDPNFIFMNEVTFTYLFALFLFRAGMRMGNSEAIMAGRTKFSPLFFGLHQTFYQEIELRDLIIRASMPDQLSNYIASHETFSVSGVRSKGEGGDFILEAKNRKIKRLMPPGLPNEDKWGEVCKNADTLDKIRETIEEIIGKKTDAVRSHKHQVTAEVICLRKMIKDAGYFSSPEIERKHVSLSKKELDRDLVNFSSQSKGNRDIYMSDYAAGIPIGKGEKLCPIFTTVEKRENFYKIERRSKDEIKDFILTMIKNIRDTGDTATSHYLQTIWEKEIKSGTKKMYINFYSECSEALLGATSHEAEEDDDDET